jgi:hypothetical protein
MRPANETPFSCSSFTSAVSSIPGRRLACIRSGRLPSSALQLADDVALAQLDLGQPAVPQGLQELVVGDRLRARAPEQRVLQDSNPANASSQ